MIFAVLLAAMLSGLCAGAVAAPIGEQLQIAPTPADLPDAFARPIIKADLDFFASSISDDLRDTQTPPPYPMIAGGLMIFLGLLAGASRVRRGNRSVIPRAAIQ